MQVEETIKPKALSCSWHKRADTSGADGTREKKKKKKILERLRESELTKPEGQSKTFQSGCNENPGKA